MRGGLLALDMFLIVLGSLSALALRSNFEISEAQFYPFLPYLGTSLLAVLVIFPLAGINRSIWRFSSLHDHIRLTVVLACCVAAAVALTFAVNRLEGIARSLPVLQFLTCTAFLIGARVLHRLHHELRHHRKAAQLFQAEPSGDQTETILIVGISRLAEAYLQASAEFMPGKIKVAGLLGRADRHAGRLVATCPILGVPEELRAVLDTLEVHGVAIDRIVVTQSLAVLSEHAANELLLSERERNIELLFLGEKWGLAGKSETRRREVPPAASAAQAFEISEAMTKAIAARRYWRFKRLCDIMGALLCLIPGSTLLLVAALLAAADVGFPIIFWQQRPGLGGRPFRLYKLRTMRPAHAPDGRRLSDEERASKIGEGLRRLRLDELPQLYNILIGDMSFVGPRPLLPKDQPSSYRARLLVRPGLTGWAQVQGGRTVSPADKAALDVWYVLNASLHLDIRIALRTVGVVLFGERASPLSIGQAWQALADFGIIATPNHISDSRRLHLNRPEYKEVPL